MATAKKPGGRTASKARITRGPARAVARSKTIRSKVSAQSKRQGKAKAKAKSAAMMARPPAKAKTNVAPKTKTKAAKTKARKAAPKKKKTQPAKKQIMGESDYQASRRFLKDRGDFVARNEPRIPQMGRDSAKVLDGAEGDSLRDAEEKARARARE